MLTSSLLAYVVGCLSSCLHRCLSLLLLSRLSVSLLVDCVLSLFFFGYLPLCFIEWQSASLLNCPSVRFSGSSSASVPLLSAFPSFLPPCLHSFTLRHATTFLLRTNNPDKYPCWRCDFEDLLLMKRLLAAPTRHNFTPSPRPISELLHGTHHDYHSQHCISHPHIHHKSNRGPKM